MAARKKLVVIDGKSVFYRGYYAMPNLSAKDGTPTGGVYGFTMMALDVLKKFDPDYVCVAWDKSKTNVRARTKIYPEYKANRKPAPEDFKVQIPLLKELLEALGWPLYEIDDYEADDIMGVFAKQAEKKDYETILVTGDHDVLQLVTDKTSVAIMKKGITNIDMYTPKTFTDKYKMNVKQFIDYKALRGDPSDNIPGVAGVGEKTATSLILEYGSIDKVYENVALIKASVAKKLEADKEMAYISKELVTIMLDADIKLDWKAADVKKVDPIALNSVMRELQFTSLIRQLPADLKVDQQSGASSQELAENENEKIIDAKNTKVLVLKNQGELSGLSLRSKDVLVLPRFGESHGRSLQSVLISETKTQVYSIPVASPDQLDLTGDKLPESAVLEKLASVLKGKNIIGFETKQLLQSFLRNDLPLPNVGHDLKIASFVIDPLQRDVSLQSVLMSSLGYDISELNEDNSEKLANKINSLLWALYDHQEHRLNSESGLRDLLQGIEFPFITPLAKMEHYGIKLDSDYLAKFSEELEDDILDLEQTIYGYADKEFNVGSPSQLATVLYEDLELSTVGIKKGKTGFSTAAGELKKLQGMHPIIDSISKFRESSKLKSTYVDALPKLVDKNDRLHSSFSQTTTSTGRLSSSDPNMQNIPIRSKLGQRVRKALVAEKDHVFIQADYSQFELRLAACLSGDKNLVEIFNTGIDIHTQTAVRVLGIDEAELTKDQRSKAKAVNFGILYGQGPHGLSEGTGMSMVEAKEFIDKYYKTYPQLKEYLDGLAEQAKEGGYVSTLLGRKRPTPDAKSSNFMVRNGAIRAAVNMPIQGTAADLVKMAMIEIDKKLPKNAHQVLQIHDSIIVECPEKDADEISEMMREIMERIYALPVKLKVDIATGKDWGEL